MTTTIYKNNKDSNYAIEVHGYCPALMIVIDSIKKQCNKIENNLSESRMEFTYTSQLNNNVKKLCNMANELVNYEGKKVDMYIDFNNSNKKYTYVLMGQNGSLYLNEYIREIRK